VVLPCPAQLFPPSLDDDMPVPALDGSPLSSPLFIAHACTEPAEVPGLEAGRGSPPPPPLLFRLKGRRSRFYTEADSEGPFFPTSPFLPPVFFL